MNLISKEHIHRKIRDILPPGHVKIFLEKSSLLGDGSQLRCDTHVVEEVVRQIHEEKIDYVFVSAKTYFNQSVLARKLTARGFKCISVSLVPRKASSRDTAFENVYHLSIVEMINVMQKTKTTIFSQGWLFRHCINVALDLFKSGNTHFVDLMDLNSFWFPEGVNVRLDLIKKCWGDDALQNNAMQRWCERYLLKNADRIYFPGSSRHIESLGLDQQELGRRYFINHPIIKDMFVDNPCSDGLVFAGGVPPFDERRVPEIFGDAQLVSTFVKFLKNEYHGRLDAYNNPYLLPLEDYERAYRPHFELMTAFPNYRFLRGFEGNELRERLARYAVGLMVYNFKGNIIGPQHFRNMIPTKFYLYLEAGLPIAISEEWEEASLLVKKHEIGLVLRQNELPYLPEIIKEVDLDALSFNVKQFRQSLYQTSLTYLQ